LALIKKHISGALMHICNNSKMLCTTILARGLCTHINGSQFYFCFNTISFVTIGYYFNCLAMSQRRHLCFGIVWRNKHELSCNVTSGNFNAQMGAYEFKQAKIDVKMTNFLQFLLHLFMWCHFNGMWIMESCALKIIWINWEIKKWIKKIFQYQNLVWTKDVQQLHSITLLSHRAL